MPGLIKQKVDLIVERRSRGNPTIAATTKTKLILKGLNPDRYDAGSPDDAAILERVRAVAAELGVQI